MVQATREKFAFLFEAAQTGKISQSAVESFLFTTANLLQQMLKSESPIIPWTGLKTYDPLFVEVDARQQSYQTDATAEDDFQGWRIVAFKRPVLLSCNHRQVKIDKGKVRLEVPQDMKVKAMMTTPIAQY